jgi:hypothetical protein
MAKLWKVKEGATAHLKERGYFNYETGIDGLIGIQCGDYRHCGYNYPHVGLDLINTEFQEIGISTDWLIPIE